MIHVDNLTYAYPRQAEPALHELIFTIGSGEIFGFLGPSGAGKSTTQKLLTGLLHSYSGSARVFGSELRRKPRDFYERIGVAFEFPNFYQKFTALENLQHFRSLYKSKTLDPMECLARFGLADAAHLKVAQFSKGMRMRLNVCRALLHDPELLFLDEPTSGLDPVNAEAMKQQFMELRAQGKTIVLNTHNMHAADELCDRVAFLVDGRIRLIDSPRELKLRFGNRKIRVEYVGEAGKTGSRDFDLHGIGHNPDFTELLRTRPIETIHSQEATLEHIFIQVTGRSLTT
ncbi:ABC transporter ATP-binding protein [Paenibacillus athensensis]|uniref:ABC transporter ATP-binding protein n=1 Tax=Paenibacillus athensensis TaxID=1967502 RepID=A0A4Y8Q7E4_9BACL|nr:ABC transporter ATP-binding protein [Paenibacillus athensensis]MCD1259585.1 ABC transporter ATP-binding protein [Paenibacillus athensensis]